MDFGEYIVNGIPLTIVVLVLVELFKGLGLSGKSLTVTSFSIGLVLGIAYQLSIELPVNFAGWFGAIVFGLALGGLASGSYDAVKSAVRSGMSK